LCETLPAENERLREELDDAQEALWRIKQWADAYPTDIFPEADSDYLKRAHQALKAHGMTIDRISASTMRHCLKGVGDIARAAVKEPSDE